MSKKKKEINYKLVEAAISFTTEQATCKVKIPSDVPPRYEGPLGDDRMACLLVMDEADIHCVEMMRNYVHENILHALVVTEKEGFIGVWTESFTDSVWNYLKSTSLGSLVTTKENGKRVVRLPTDALQTFISQVFDGLRYLWARGKYHGNFKLENTKYHRIPRGERVVKLTCFKRKGMGTLRQCQAEDCQAVGAALKNISETAVAWNTIDLSFDCYIIDDLVGRLENFAGGDLEFIKEDILGHPFFWTLTEVETFFISTIPIALTDLRFHWVVKDCEELCDLPWNNKSFGGLLQVMVDYRAERNIKAYDFHDRVNYVQFLSGLFAHGVQLEMCSRIADVVMAMKPPPYMILFNLIPKEPRAPKS